MYLDLKRRSKRRVGERILIEIGAEAWDMDRASRRDAV